MIKAIGILTWCVVLTLARPNPGSGGIPKRKFPLHGSGFRSLDPETNLTMDQIMTQQLGGISEIGNKMMDSGGLILAELDLRLTPEQYAAFYGTESVVTVGSRGRSKRKAVKDPMLRWFHGEIPYTFAENTFDAKDTVLIKEAMTEWERYTCLNFKAATPSHTNVVDFINGDSCSSQLGMVGGRQALMLNAPGCRFRGLYLHEIGHAIGLIHEHQRPDRDSYVDISLQNVAPSLQFSFTKYPRDKVDLVNTEYEYSSIMHYGVTAFSRDGKLKTLRPKDPAREEEIGKVYLKELSFNDVLAVNNMYNCAGNCPATVKCEDGGFVDQTCRCVCPDGTRDCEVGYKAPETDGDCSNAYDDWQCAVWANSGQCTRNNKFMSTGCMRACQLCSYTVAPTGSVGCEDLYPKKCAKWKKNGDCVANEWWMSLNCRKTCNACVDKSQRSETQCENKFSDSSKCDKWAADGECKINPAWMLINCRKSCQTCDQTPPVVDETTGNCVDIHSDKQACADWARAGECKANPTWMQVNCKKSCGICSGGGSVVTTKPVKCVDTDLRCSSWAATGECLKNPNWMLDNCAVSCDVCVPDSVTTPFTPDITHPTVGPQVPCTNLHDDSECGVWASTGHCEINPDWMHHNCRKACRLCVEVKATPSPPDCTCKNSGSGVMRPPTFTLLTCFTLLFVLAASHL